MLQKGLDILKLTDELRWSLLEIKQLNQYTNTRLSKKKKKRKKKKKGIFNSRSIPIFPTRTRLKENFASLHQTQRKTSPRHTDFRRPYNPHTPSQPIRSPFAMTQYTLIAVSCAAMSPRVYSTSNVRFLAKHVVFVVHVPRMRLCPRIQVVQGKAVHVWSVVMFRVTARFERCADTHGARGAAFGECADLAEEAREEGLEGGKAGCEDADVHFDLLPKRTGTRLVCCLTGLIVPVWRFTYQM
jgi:hypothetical protein